MLLRPGRPEHEDLLVARPRFQEEGPMEDLKELEARVPLMKLARDPHGHLLSTDQKLPENPYYKMLQAAKESHVEDRLKAPLAGTHPRLSDHADDRDESPARDGQQFGGDPMLPTRIVERCAVFSVTTRLDEARVDLARPDGTVVSWTMGADRAQKFRVGTTVRLILEVL